MQDEITSSDLKVRFDSLFPSCRELETTLGPFLSSLRPDQEESNFHLVFYICGLAEETEKQLATADLSPEALEEIEKVINVLQAIVISQDPRPLEELMTDELITAAMTQESIDVDDLDELLPTLVPEIRNGVKLYCRIFSALPDELDEIEPENMAIHINATVHYITMFETLCPSFLKSELGQIITRCFKKHRRAA